MAIEGAITSVVPDIILLDALQKGIVAVRLNYNAVMNGGSGIPGDTFLGIIFKNLPSVENFNVYDTAVKLLITTPENPRHLFVKLSYDMNSSKYPSVHITMPSESDQYNVLGIGEGNESELFDSVTNTWSPQFVRSFNTTYQIVIMSDNKNEVAVLYHFFKSLLIALYDHLHQKGINNLKMSGGDVSYSPNVPDRTFIRNIGLNFIYETSSTQLNVNPVIDDIVVTLVLDEDDGDSESDSI